MERPITRYAKSGDVSVAYQVTGSGPVDLVWAPGTISHLDLDWEHPPKVAVIERVSSFSRLIRFDKRGTGLSDRPTEAATLEERTDDIRAVMDAAGSESAVIFGLSEGANMACVFAATYPGRTRSLMIWGGQARWVRADDYPWGASREEEEEAIARLEGTGVTLEYVFGAGGGVNIDTAFRDWWLRYFQAGASPSALAALERMNLDIDTRDILPAIGVPTLVMNRVADPVADVRAARDLAASIPGARFVEFPGDTHMIFTVDAQDVLAEIQEWVTGLRPVPAPTRALSTVMFTDIVGSTERAVELGDARWSELLQQHHAIARDELVRFSGREVDNAGDGFFATFDGPARAVRCARAIELGVRQLGIEVRAGVHTGECELVGEKVGGIAVHIGARVASSASAGEVLVSSTVKDLVVGSGLVFEDRGVHTLKGVPDEWRLFSLVGDR